MHTSRKKFLTLAETVETLVHYYQQKKQSHRGKSIIYHIQYYKERESNYILGKNWKIKFQIYSKKYLECNEHVFKKYQRRYS